MSTSKQNSSLRCLSRRACLHILIRRYCRRSPRDGLVLASNQSELWSFLDEEFVYIWLHISTVGDLFVLGSRCLLQCIVYPGELLNICGVLNVGIVLHQVLCRYSQYLLKCKDQVHGIPYDLLFHVTGISDYRTLFTD